MEPHRTPILLLVWMLMTWCFSYPIAFWARWLHHRMDADPRRFPERLGEGGSSGSRDVIWFQAASLGEVMQIGPLARHLNRTQEFDILVTTTTAAGADWVSREMPYATHRFVPIDTPSAVRRFLDEWSIAVAVFVEGDLWPRLVRESQRRGIPQVLLNARHSRTRERLPAVFASLLAPFSLVTCRSQDVADGMLSLGLPAERVRVLPDLRLTLPRLAAPSSLTDTLSMSIGSGASWLAASTHPADEDAVLAAHQEVLQAFPEALLVVAPRHPRRGWALYDMACDKALTVARRSQKEEITAETQVYIADTLGELGAFFAISPVAFMGGSFGEEGGHNPYEPAAFGVAILSGRKVKNFSDAYAALTEVGAAILVERPEDLGKILTTLMESRRAEEMGKAGLAFMEASKDSVSTYGQLIAELLRPKGERR